MVKVYLGNISEIDSQKKFDEIFLSLPKFRQDKINSYKHEKDKKLSLLAGYLLQKAIKIENLEGLDHQIIVDKNGKEFFLNNELFFSISHSGEMAMVAISDKEIGCDVEEIKQPDFDLAKRFFTKQEYEEIMSSKEQIKTFYSMWTVKESYLKLIGTGLKGGLDKIAYLNGEISDTNFDAVEVSIDSKYIAYYVIKK